jgi:hypothetical protein
VKKTDKTANNDAHIETRVDLASQLGLALSTLNTNVKNHEAKWKKLHPVRDCLQAGEILETHTGGGTGNCYCHVFQASMCQQCCFRWEYIGRRLVKHCLYG